MNNSVVIKGNKYGIVVVLDNSTPFSELKKDIVEKFSSASKFFDKANMAISFEGRVLSSDEEKEILDLIAENSDLNIVCVIDTDKAKEDYYKRAIEEKVEELSSHTGQFYKGTLRSGQVLEAESGIIILGDVNPGARVIARGSIIVLGALKGHVTAGSGGNEDSFVVALEMQPMQIRIGDVIARSDDNNTKKSKTLEPKIAFVEDGNIYIEKLDKNVISDIKL